MSKKLELMKKLEIHESWKDSIKLDDESEIGISLNREGISELVSMYQTVRDFAFGTKDVMRMYFLEDLATEEQIHKAERIYHGCKC